ncbi:MAG: PAS domain S-box protein [Flavobacteriaceae bacterium]|nr:PAS domain S-box protein [Flavobacteriaceae bacterium]
MNKIISPSNYSTLNQLSKQELIALLLNQQAVSPLQESIPTTSLTPILKDSLKNINAGFMFVDNEGFLLCLNKTAEKLIGKSKKNLIGKNIWKEFPGKKGDLFFDNFHASIDKNRSFNFRSYFRPWKKWFENIIIPSKYGVSVFFNDITQEVALDKNKTEAYMFLKQSSHVSFMWLNKPGWPIEYVSDNVEQLLGYSQEYFITKKIKYQTIIHPNDLKRLKKQASIKLNQQSLTSANDTVSYPPYRIIKKNGEIIWVSETNVFQTNENGDIESYRGVIKDVTEQQKIKYTLDLITNSTSHIVGKEFLDTICLEITKSLQSDLTFIGFLNNTDHIIETISVSNRQGNTENFEYNTDYTPCEITLALDIQSIPKNVTKLYPKDSFLINSNYEGYVGVSLFDKNQKPIGIIVSLFKKPIEDEDFTKTILQIFSTRIAAEIQSIKNKEEATKNQQEAWGLFDDAASPIWIQDLSKVKLYFDTLKENGVLNFMDYIHDNPQDLKHINSLIVLKKANKKSLELFNISDVNSLPKNLSQFLITESVPALLQGLNNVFKNKRKSTEEYPMLINGVQKTIIVAAIIPDFSQNTYEKILFTFNDITEQRKTEKLLQESRKSLQDQLDNTPLAAITCDLNGTITSWNQAAETIFGYRMKEAIGENFKNIVTFNSTKREDLVFFKKLKEYKNVQYTIQTVTKQGLVRTTRWYVIPLMDANNNIIGNGALTQDITDEVEANKKIEFSEKRYRDLFKKSNDPVLIFDNDLIIDYNKAALKVLQISDIKELLLKPVASISPKYQPSGKRSKKLSENNHQKARKNGQHQFEWVLQRKDNSTFPAEVSITSIETKNKKTILHVIFRDITARKNSKKNLENALEKAKQSDKLKSAFLANMSHEIRTPMNGIIGFSELFLEPDLSNEDRKYYADIVINSSKQLLHIVNNILDISQIEAGMVHVKKEAVNLNMVLSNTKAFFLGKANNKQLTFKISPGLTEHFIIESDLSKIQQILNNLVSNALKFTENGTIEVGYELVSNYIQFFVKDTGIGIKKNHKEKIFNRFTQANFDISTHFGGNGLGLSISQKLVLLLNGKIWVESVYSKGSNFFFTIPYKTKNTIHTLEKTTKNTLESPLEIIKKRTILVADDEAFNILFIKEVFSGEHYTVLEATNGKEAVEMCHKHAPDIDLVLMDVKMPLMNGLEATKIIKKKHPQIPIVALSAYAMESDMHKALSYGCDKAISKPVNKKTLLNILDAFTLKN